SMKERLKKARWHTTPSTSGSATASMEISLPVQSTPTLPTSADLPQAARARAAKAPSARRTKAYMGRLRSVVGLRNGTAAGFAQGIAAGSAPGLAVHGPLQPAHQQRQRDGHGQVEEGDDVVGFEEQEAAGRRQLAQLGDVLHPQRRDQRRILDHGDEIIAQGRQDGAQRLREDDETEARPARQAQRAGRRD